MVSRHAPIVDFHSHYLPPRQIIGASRRAEAERHRPLDRIAPRIGDPDAILSDLRGAGIATRVLSVPLPFVAPGGDQDSELIHRINDHLADLAGRHPGRLSAHATIDAFAGDEGAREVERVATELGFRSIFIDSARDRKLLNAESARPVLIEAARRGLTVFAHPINPPELREQAESIGGSLGVRLARGTVNAASLLSLIQAGVFETVPGLHLVVTTLAVQALTYISIFDDAPQFLKQARNGTRQHLYVDTMGAQPAFIRYAAELLGADHVVAGSDWPIAGRDISPDQLLPALQAAGLTEAEQALVAGGNAARLLGLALPDVTIAAA
ncbi:amidohydrolase family protein [Bosea sp. RCC_152_1]|uniref:amidohydrolase family protein n=1 Tax=Bosea sp. RCC_152_1 TaxID=3239228 RepID=UPI00352527BA